MLEDKSKLDQVGKQGGARIYVPSNLVNDSQFPIKLGKEVILKIDTDKKTLVISQKE